MEVLCANEFTYKPILLLRIAPSAITSANRHMPKRSGSVPQWPEQLFECLVTLKDSASTI
jgi:hypothetical protein